MKAERRLSDVGREPFRWNPERDEQLRKFHAQGLMPIQIAKKMGCTDTSVRSRLKRLGLEWVKSNKKTPPIENVKRPHMPMRMPRSKVDPLNMAEQTLKSDFDKSQMRFKGTPIRFLDLMKEVNRVRKGLGQEQWTGDESCVIR